MESQFINAGALHLREDMLLLVSNTARVSNNGLSDPQILQLMLVVDCSSSRQTSMLHKHNR